MKKIFSIFTAVLFASFIMTSCSGASAEASAEATADATADVVAATTDAASTSDAKAKKEEPKKK